MLRSIRLNKECAKLFIGPMGDVFSNVTSVLDKETSRLKYISFKSVYSSLPGISMLKVSSDPVNGVWGWASKYDDDKIEVFVGGE
jgi:hypothetical protein